VDHGKTYAGGLPLRQTGTFRANEQCRTGDGLRRSRAGEGDHHPREEHGVNYRGVKINIVRYPRHADFGGEGSGAWRWWMAVLLLGDCAKGPFSRRARLGKALALGLPAVVGGEQGRFARMQGAGGARWRLLPVIDIGAKSNQSRVPVSTRSLAPAAPRWRLSQTFDDLPAGKLPRGGGAPFAGEAARIGRRARSNHCSCHPRDGASAREGETTHDKLRCWSRISATTTRRPLGGGVG